MISAFTLRALSAPLPAGVARRSDRRRLGPRDRLACGSARRRCSRRLPPFDPEGFSYEIVGMRIDRKRLEEVRRRNDVERLLVFGSVARGEETEQSDVDLLVRFTKRKSLLDLVRIEREFSEALGRKVDLLTEGSLSPYLRDQILGQAAVLYERAA